MTLIEANKRLRQLESGNRSLLDALDSARKVEVDLETLKKEKVAVEKSPRIRLTSLRLKLGSWKSMLIN